MQELRKSGGLYPAAERGAINDERSTDSLRTRFALAIRGFGERVRGLAESIHGHVKQLQDLSNLLTSKTTRLERRVEGLEQRERSMIEALDAQTALTDQWREQSATLVTRVNTLLSELKK